MGSLQQRFLITAFGLATAASFGAAVVRFLPDDPLLREPPPLDVGQLKGADINDMYDFIEQTFVEPRREDPEKRRPHAARNINTLGEVPDSSWYTNRHAFHRMSIDELVRGPGADSPDPSQPWRIVAGKNDGISPGFVIEDARGHRYVLKFDSPLDPETASAADVITSKFMYALGYNVPEDSVVYYRRHQLVLRGRAIYHDASGHRRTLSEADVEDMLKPLSTDNQGRYRALASRYIEGKILGPFLYTGTRSDDPNDIVPHEDHRELRGLRVFYGWLNNTDAKAKNTLDTIVDENGRRFVRHYLIDFTAAMGTDGVDKKDARLGHEYFVDLKPTAVQMATLGIYVPRWMRAHYPHLIGVGRFGFSVFEPKDWKPNYPNPAFDLMDRDDAFWAAKQVAAFTDEEIRAVVKSGELSDPVAAGWVAKCLIERRDRVVRAFLAGTAPLDRFRVEEGRLRFTDLQPSSERWTIRWSTFNNQTGIATPLSALEGPDVNAAVAAAPNTEFLVADVAAGAGASSVRVYLRRDGHSARVVGLDRLWGHRASMPHDGRQPTDQSADRVAPRKTSPGF